MRTCIVLFFCFLTSALANELTKPQFNTNQKSQLDSNEHRKLESKVPTNSIVSMIQVEDKIVNVESLPEPESIVRLVVELDSLSLLEMSKLPISTSQSVEYLNNQIVSSQKTLVSNLMMKNLISSVNRKIRQTNNLISVNAKFKDLDSIRNTKNVKSVRIENQYSISLTDSVSMINADDVWIGSANEQGYTGQGVSVAIIDTGIDYTHPDLGGCFGKSCKVKAGYDFVDNDSDPMDTNSHGTHVAGIVAARGIVFGVAPDADLVAVRVLNTEGNGWESDIIAGIEFVMDPNSDGDFSDHFDVMNLSLGGAGHKDDSISKAVNAAVDAGVVAVVAAGNNGMFGDIEQTSPASAEKAITVGSVNKSGGLSVFSSKGPLTESSALKPEIVAPGSEIISTVLEQGHAIYSGTSMAAPHVAGVAALIKQQRPEISTEFIKSLIMQSGVELGLSPYAQGSGLVDALKATESKIVIDTTGLDFGLVDLSQSSWSKELSFTIHNQDDEKRELEIALEQNLPDGISLEVSETAFEIQEGESKLVTVFLTIDNINEISKPEDLSLSFYDTLNIKISDEIYTLPIALDWSRRLLLDNQTDSRPSVIIESPTTNFFFYSYLTENTSSKIRVGFDPVLVYVSYIIPKDANINWALSEQATVIGLESFSVDSTSDNHLLLKHSNLTNVYGYNSILDFEGTSDLSLFKNLSSVSYLDNTSTVYSHSIRGGQHAYFIYGNIASNTKVTNYSTSLINSTDGELRFYIDGEIFEHGISSDVLLDVNLATAPVVELLKPTYQSADNILVGIRNRTHLSEGHLTDKDSLFLHGKSGLDQSLSNGVYFTNNNLKNGRYSGKVELQNIYFNDSDQAVSYDYLNNPQSILLDNNSVNAESVYWRGVGRFNESGFTITNEFSLESAVDAHLQATNRVKYIDGLDSQFQLICDEELIDSQSILLKGHIEIDADITACELPVLTLEYDNYLDDEKFRSSVSFQNTLNSSIVNLNNISFKQLHTETLENNLDKILPEIVFEADFEFIQAFNVWIKLGEDDWKFHELEQINSKKARIKLPLDYGESVASLKIELNSIEAQTTYLLNGFFKLGTPAGDNGDADNDGIGNNADTDDDNDGVHDDDDAFPLDATESVDTDNDGIGNNADTDDDNDGVHDDDDSFPLDATESVDTDNDGFGNNADTDDDNDGVHDEDDAFPLDPTESLDTDNDGIGNNADTDDDNDGVPDADDAFPLDQTESVDTDNDGIGNNADIDDDNDGMPDTFEEEYGFDALDSSDANSDADSDGRSNLQEFQDGTDPTDASSVKKSNTSKSAGGGSISFFLLIILFGSLLRKRHRL